MLPGSCVTPQYGPLGCANLNLPHYGDGNKGWHVNLGWFSDHPIITFVLIAVVLTIAKSVTQHQIERS